jgi:hypothetical protein
MIQSGIQLQGSFSGLMIDAFDLIKIIEFSLLVYCLLLQLDACLIFGKQQECREESQRGAVIK